MTDHQTGAVERQTSEEVNGPGLTSEEEMQVGSV